MEKPFIYPSIIGPEDLADISLSPGQEGSTRRSTKFVFAGMENFFLLPQIRSVSVTRIPVNKYRLIPIFRCRVHGRDSTTWSNEREPGHNCLFTQLVRSRQALLYDRMNHNMERSRSSVVATRGVSQGQIGDIS